MPYVKDPCACDLLDKLLVLDPSKRCDSDSALDHDFFWTEPMPYDLSKMLAQHTQSTFQYDAPQCSPGHIQPHHHHQDGNSAGGKLVTPTYEGYQEKVY
jgi:cyclin-dependent kinase 9